MALPFNANSMSAPAVELCQVIVSTSGESLYIFGEAVFQLDDDERPNVDAVLTRDGEFAHSERRAARHGEATLVTLSTVDRPTPGRHVFSLWAARLTEIEVVSRRCSIAAYEYIEVP